jgi:hypothetical protein
VHVGARPDHARDLLVEEDRKHRCLHSALRDVVGIVEPDREELAWPNWSQKADAVERVVLVGAITIDRMSVFDDAVPCSAIRLKPAELHEPFPSFPF